MKFRKEIDSNGVKRELHFHLFKKGSTPVFLVYFQDEDGGPVAFTMDKEETGIWKVLPQTIPAWTTEAHLQISDAINDHLEEHPEGETPMTSSWNILGS